MIAIDRGVQQPVRSKYPYMEMEIGDSCFAPGITAKRAWSYISRWRRLTGRSFSVRSCDGGVRIWRTA